MPDTSQIGVWLPIDDEHPQADGRRYLVSNGTRYEVATISMRYGIWSSSFYPTHYFEYPECKEVTSEQLKTAFERHMQYPGL